ncbi:hypothetical protein Tco_0115739 [Tanacetum coccineum]
MDTLEQQLTKETILESNCKNAFRVLKTQFEKIFTSVLIKPSSLDGTYARKDFHAYTGMEPQLFKETIIKTLISLKIICSKQSFLHKRFRKDKGNDQGLKNDQDLQNQSNTSGDKSSRSRNECNDKSTSGDDTDIRPSYDTETIVEVPYTAEYNVFDVDTQHSEQPQCIINTWVVEKADSNVTPDSPDQDMCD